jgi:hypothetical protein
MDNAVTFTKTHRMEFDPNGTLKIIKSDPNATSTDSTSTTLNAPNLVSSAAANTPINGTLHDDVPAPVLMDPRVPQIVDYKTSLTNRVSDALEHLNVSAAASILVGGVSASGGGSYIQEDKIQQSDLTYVLSVKVTNDITALDINDMKFNNVDKITQDQDTFIGSYGDGFISGFIKGGEFSAIVSMVMKDTGSLKDVKANLKLDTASFNASGEGSWNKTSNDNLSEINYTVNWKGGGQIKDATAKWDMMSILQAATEIPSRVSAFPETCFAIITKYEHLKSFAEQAPDWWADHAIDYDMAAVYTNDLLDQFLEYKTILKRLAEIIHNLLDYERSSADPDAYPVDWKVLSDVKKKVKGQMALIAKEVDLVTGDPKRATTNALADAGIKDPIGDNKSPSNNNKLASIDPKPSSGDVKTTKSPVVVGSDGGQAVPNFVLSRRANQPRINIDDPQGYSLKLPVRKKPDARNMSTRPINLAGNPRAIRTAAGLVEVFCVGTDHRLWHKWFDGSAAVKPAFQPDRGSWEPFGQDDLLISAEQDISAVSRGDSTTDLRDVFVIGADSKLWRKSYSKNKWNNWQKVSDEVWASSPCVVTFGTDRLDVAIRGYDGHIWRLILNKDTWSGPTMVGSPDIIWTAAPLLAKLSTDPKSTDMWLLTTEKSGTLCRTFLSETSPKPTERLGEGCRFSFARSSVTLPNGTIGHFWIGNGDNGAFAATYGKPDQPTDGTRLRLEPCACISSCIAVASSRAFFAFVGRGNNVSDGAGSLLSHSSDLSWNVKQWGPDGTNVSIVIPGPVVGDPTAVAGGDQVDVFIRGLSGKLWRNRFDGTTWGMAEEI